ncbi:DUF1801 domain-containing protein [Sphingomonas sp. HDW15A]|nr:DUF1801 domain-containing protein [Sphingomonas sp. HDW15A]
MVDNVENFRARIDPQSLDTVDALRALIERSHSGLTERIKWNAPSFAVGDEDRITLGVERSGGVRVVFHRGAKPRSSEGFSFQDSAGIARWLAPDRGIVIFRNREDVEERAEAFLDLCTRWLAATS